MSEMSEKARSEGKEKVKRLTGERKGAVDASGWTEDEYGCGLMHQEKKLGNRPISKQNLATGGVASHKHAGRKSRDMGGPMSSAGQNLVAQVPAPPQNRFSFSGNQSPLLAAAGMKKGGRAHFMDGGGQGMGGSRKRLYPSYTDSELEGFLKDKHPDHPDYNKMKGEVEARRSGASKYFSTPQVSPSGGMTPINKVGRMAAGGKLKRAEGGQAEEIEGKRAVGGRYARASGGSAKKGTTVNIIIAQKPEHQMMPGGAPGGAMPPPKPPMPMMPPGGPGAPPPMGPQGAPAGPMPGGPNMPPPSMQPHAKGGSVYPDMKFSAANGKGRLEKVRKYGE